MQLGLDTLQGVTSWTRVSITDIDRVRCPDFYYARQAGYASHEESALYFYTSILLYSTNANEYDHFEQS